MDRVHLQVQLGQAKKMLDRYQEVVAFVGEYPGDEVPQVVDDGVSAGTLAQARELCDLWRPLAEDALDRHWVALAADEHNEDDVEVRLLASVYDLSFAEEQAAGLLMASWGSSTLSDLVALVRRDRQAMTAEGRMLFATVARTEDWPYHELVRRCLVLGADPQTAVTVTKAVEAGVPFDQVWSDEQAAA